MSKYSFKLVLFGKLQTHTVSQPVYPHSQPNEPLLVTNFLFFFYTEMYSWGSKGLRWQKSI